MPFKMVVSGPPEDVARLKILGDNGEMVTHLHGKMKEQSLSPAEHYMVVIALSVRDNPLGEAFMRLYVDPKWDGEGDGTMYGCTGTRKDLSAFFTRFAPAYVNVAAPDLGAGRHRIVVIANDGATKLDAELRG